MSGKPANEVELYKLNKRREEAASIVSWLLNERVEAGMAENRVRVEVLDNLISTLECDYGIEVKRIPIGK